ncbi:MAG: MarR family winged helix-turn-helix transcriptional regulator [Vallitaleaceae bacterium]|jgi:DNA-binding MarR family transcriptional regulator|nr:MarR family winged helix-turn-helix transcriptional regulator [Vallitaleaceae bacterium]
MSCPKNRLYEAYYGLYKLRGDCTCQLIDDCDGMDITLKQIEYLKLIDNCEDMTFSQLVKLTHNSKPTVTEMVNKCIKSSCLYKEKSEYDGRVSYLHLTDKGKKLARSEQIALLKTVDKIMNALNDDELDMLSSLLEKVGKR